MPSDPIPLDYHRPRPLQFRPWVKRAFWIGLLLLGAYAWHLVPTGWSRHGWVCHVCGRHQVRASYYVGEIKVYTRTRILDGDAGPLYDQLIAEPHAHDWHKAGFTTHHGGDGFPGDADELIPVYALDFVDQHLRGLGIEERRAIYRRLITGSKRWEDVSTKCDAELKALREQGKIPAR